MAYGAENGGWYDVWNNGYYSVGLFWIWKVDTENRKVYVRINSIRVCSLNGYYSFYNNDGCTANYRIATDTDGIPYKLTTQAFNVSGGGCDTKPDQQIDREFDYKDDGTLPNIYLSAEFYNNCSAINGPSFSWTMNNITGLLPTIGVKATETKPKRYNSSSWGKGTLKRYNGSKWVKVTDVKRYDGTKWVSHIKS